ncbi:ABC transporter substrate-binding protein [Motilimonas cestriensis]|uniref:ABC transporter substrate-binding protein n=1 Tax=Motilimonas cestriensis TaxID=2742685 RepID=UPI003DA2714D
MIRLIALLLTLPIMTSCKQETQVQSTGLVYCSNGSPTSFNPQLAQTGDSLDISSQLYNTLVRLDPSTQTIAAGLASEWHVSRDGLSYQFELRQDIQFHSTPYFTPTRTMNADDVVFSFQRVLFPTHPFHSVSGGLYPFFNNTQFSRLIKSIKKIGPYKVEFELYRPDTSLLANLATEFAVVLSAEYAQQLQHSGKFNQIDHLPVGTGPYKFKQFLPDNLIRFERHWGYWEGGAPMQQLVFDITPSPTKRLAKLITGECDVMAYPAASQANVISNHPDLLMNVQTGYKVSFWSFNSDRPPFDNPKVRKALATAIDRDTILKAVYFNTGVAAHGLLPPTSWAYNPYLSDYAYSPKQARQLLQESGVKLPLSLTIYTPSGSEPYNPNSFKTAEFIQRDLRKIGVNAEIVVQEPHLLQHSIIMGKYDTLVSGWSAVTSDPDNFFRPQFSCNAIENHTNTSRWCSTELDGLINRAVKLNRMVPRIRIYREIQSHLRDELPLLPIAHSLQLQAYRRDVHSLNSSPFGGVNFAGAYRN